MTAAELRGLMEKASARPWFTGPYYVYDVHRADASELARCNWTPQGKNDAALIVAALNALPALLAVVEAAQLVVANRRAETGMGGHADMKDLADALAPFAPTPGDAS